MAAKKTPVDKLSAEIADILRDYGDEIRQDMDEAIKKVTKAGVKAIKASAKRTFKGSGAYAKGWTSTVETGKHSAKGIIYNKDLPGLPHLLEHGHLNQDGSRTPGRPHIGPVEDQIGRDFLEQIERSIE